MRKRPVWHYAWFSFAVASAPDAARPESVVFFPVDPSAALLRAFDSGAWAVPMNLKRSARDRAVELTGVTGWSHRASSIGVRLDDSRVIIGGFASQIEATARSEGTPWSAGYAGHHFDVGQEALKTAIDMLMLATGPLLAAGLKKLWDKFKRKRQKPLAAEDVERSARWLICVEFEIDSDKLVDPSVRRNDADDGWVVRIKSPEEKRLYIMRLSDQTGAGLIEYEPSE